MTHYVPSRELVELVKRGDFHAIGRLISRAESGTDEPKEALAEIYRLAGRAHIIGITGVPGGGKSTLVAKLAALLRTVKRNVAIVAVDPSSPYSNGAILGDRIRMSELAGDPGIFIRSMATRGAVGGLARCTLDVTDILDVAGFDTIIIETVGVGQDEVEISRASDTTVVVSAPGLGDDIQAIKAGMLEIADIHVVSKSDRSDANRTLMDLKQMMALGSRSGGSESASWRVPVVAVSSVNSTGFDELTSALARHREFMLHSEAGQRRRRAVAAFRLRVNAENLLMSRFSPAAEPLCAALSEKLLARKSDPHSLARQVVSAAIEGLKNRQ